MKPRAKSRQGRPLLQVERVSKMFPVERGLFAEPQFLHAVDGVSFYVRHGETLGLVGESGCGKSTLGRIVLRLTEPTLGRVLFDGHNLVKLSSSQLRTMRRRMQIIFQDPYSSLNPRMTVQEIVGEGIQVFGLAKSKRELADMVAHWLERVGLRPELRHRYPHEFSGGQRQRIGIARAMAIKPDFIVCDEPVSALDVSIQAQIVNLLEELQDELEVSYLFISHDLRVVEYVSHRVAVMYLGKLMELGPARDLAEKRYHPYTRALFSAMPAGAGKKKLRVVLEGEPPSPIDPPKGCVFHPRCPRVERGKCDREVPSLEEVVPGSHHRVACWHPHLD